MPTGQSQTASGTDEIRRINAKIRAFRDRRFAMIDSYFPHGMAPYVVGGVFIGLGVALLFATTGRIGGISTFFSAAWSYFLKSPYFQQAEVKTGRDWRLLYSLGLVLGGAAYFWLNLPQAATQLPAWKLALGGVLIGFGARLGGGCTSGHGICGMASLSRGSIAIVATFLSTAIVTAHVLTAWGAR